MRCIAVASAVTLLLPRYVKVEGTQSNDEVSVQKMGNYQEIRLRNNSQLLVRNSVLLVPLLNREECECLMKAAEELSEVQRHHALGLKKLKVEDMNEEAQALSARLLSDKLLPFLEHELPAVSQQLFGRCQNLSEMRVISSANEPAVNKYEVGGEFKGHVDGYSLTVVIPLNSYHEYRGGGTVFWPETAEEEKVGTVRIKAQRGEAVLFNGNIRHAGFPVQKGVRYLYVASFDLQDGTCSQDGKGLLRTWITEVPTDAY